MRIAEISTLSRPVPPEGEGSVEQLVGILTEGLCARGHEVTLFATADSRTSAALKSPVAQSYAKGGNMWDWQLYEAFQAREAFRHWRDFDIIHCHSYHFGMLFSAFSERPSLHSIHVDPGPDYAFLHQRTPNAHLHFASHFQARDFPPSLDTHIVPHGIDLGPYQVAPPGQREGYLAFLGRFMAEKGPLEAIAIARSAGMPLKMAAPHNQFYEQEVAPLVNGIDVEYVGELDTQQKARFLAHAQALLYPVRRGEPFGLVLIEAMACGLPVLAFDQGAVPEIISHGETGWISNNPGELAQVARSLSRFEPAAIRKTAEDRFSAARMVDEIERLLCKIAAEPICGR